MEDILDMLFNAGITLLSHDPDDSPEEIRNGVEVGGVQVKPYWFNIINVDPYFLPLRIQSVDLKNKTFLYRMAADEGGEQYRSKEDYEKFIEKNKTMLQRIGSLGDDKLDSYGMPVKVTVPFNYIEIELIDIDEDGNEKMLYNFSLYNSERCG